MFFPVFYPNYTHVNHLLQLWCDLSLYVNVGIIGQTGDEPRVTIIISGRSGSVLVFFISAEIVLMKPGLF